MNSRKKLAYKDFLKQFVTAARQEKIMHIVAQRTRSVTVVLEDVAQSHNAAAIARSCEAFGVQDLYTIEQQNTLEFKERIAQGCAKWLTLHRFMCAVYQDPLTACIQRLKEQKYTLIGTSPHARTVLHELPLNSKVAFLFGTEETGLSPAAVQACDQVVALPQQGFVESLNVSVCVALCLYDVTTRLRASSQEWHLSSPEKEELELLWLERSVKHLAALKSKFLAEYQDE